MEQKQRLIVVSVVLIAILLGSMGLVWIFLPAPDDGKSTVATNNPGTVAPPEVHLYKKQGGLTLDWRNLPAGTDFIYIYRAKKGTENWEKWKVVAIDPGTLSGSFAIDSDGNVNDYVYYAQAVQSGSGGGGSVGGGSGSGDVVLWQSETTEVEDPPAPPGGGTGDPGGSSSSTGGGDGSGSGSSSTQSGNNPPPGGGGTSTGSGTGSGSDTPTSTGPATGAYYTPEGGVSGVDEITYGDFWVIHVNENIEIGWQHLPADTTSVTIFRSTSENGPWEQLFKQTTPASPYSFRLLDNSIYTGHYYRMEMNVEGVVTTRGPIFLPALGS